MKKLLKRRNCTKWSEVFKQHYLYQQIMLNDRHEFKQKRRIKYKRVERIDLAYRAGKRNSIMIPIYRSSYNKRSRIQNQFDGVRVISKLENFNQEFGLNYKIEDLPLKTVAGMPVEG